MMETLPLDLQQQQKNHDHHNKKKKNKKGNPPLLLVSNEISLQDSQEGLHHALFLQRL